MRGFSLPSSVEFRNSEFWLLAIAAGVSVVQMTLFSKSGDASLTGNGLLFWGVAAYLIWERRDRLNLNSSLLASLGGALLLSLVLVKGSTLYHEDPFIYISPLISLLGLGLLASGFKGLKQYWQEFLIISFLVPPAGLLSRVVDISEWTARASALILTSLTYKARREGVFIFLPKGGVEVYSGCSGIANIVHLVGVSVILLVMFPTTWTKRWLLMLCAVVIAFVVNAFRVALMAILSENTDLRMFEYWHKGDGSLVFSTLSVLLLCVCFYFLVFRTENELEAEDEPSTFDTDPAAPLEPTEDG
jgi:cyanoexosortase A